MSYIGNTNTTQAFTPAVDYFNGDGSTTAFTLSRQVASVVQVQAVISNVPQNPGSAFTVLNNTITFTSAPPSGSSNIYVYYTSPITQVIAPSQGTVGTAQIPPNVGLTNPTITNYVETLQAVGTVGSTSTLALTNGTVLTATLTASTPCTFTMPTATAGKSFVLILTQAATGMTTATFTGVKWPSGTAPTITATASAVDILSFVSNGTYWYGSVAQAFA